MAGKSMTAATVGQSAVRPRSIHGQQRRQLKEEEEEEEAAGHHTAAEMLTVAGQAGLSTDLLGPQLELLAGKQLEEEEEEEAEAAGGLIHSKQLLEVANGAEEGKAAAGRWSSGEGCCAPQATYASYISCKL